jgi:predicted ester cyclase
MMTTDPRKRLVRRLIEEAVRSRDARVLEEIATDEFAAVARRWVQPFRSAFSDFEMRIVALYADGDAVVAHVACSGTHTGEWLGVAPTGRRFVDVTEIYIFTIRDGRLESAVGVEDNLSRLRQLGIAVRAA